MLLSEVRCTRAPPSCVTISTVRSPASSVRRNLFGVCDHDDVKRMLEQELRATETRDREHWEFDFVNEVPCPGRGRYRWKPTFERTNPRPVKRERCDEPDISHLYHEPVEDATVSSIKRARTVLSQSKITGKNTKYHDDITAHYPISVSVPAPLRLLPSLHP